MPSSCFGWINPFSTTKNAYMIPGDSNATLTPTGMTSPPVQNAFISGVLSSKSLSELEDMLATS